MGLNATQDWAYLLDGIGTQQPPLGAGTPPGALPPATRPPEQFPQGTPAGNPAALGNAVGSGLPPGMDMKPATTPQEHAVRKAGWLDVITKLLSDPTTGDAIMRIGLQMMQPVPVGQTPLGHAAGAVLGGMDYTERRRAGDKKETREEAESKSKIGLQGAQAQDYRTTKGKGSAGGGGTAAEVQVINQLAAALRAKDPERYANMPGQDILDAREELAAYKRAQIAAGILGKTVLPGQDVGAAADVAKAAAERLRTTGKPGATASPGIVQAPPAAIEYLKANDTPEVRAAFQAKYGYLP